MKCPICNKENSLSICYLYQYSHRYKILKNGRMSKKYIKENEGSTEHAILVCSNGCDVDKFVWELDNNYNLKIDIKRRF